MLGTVKNWKIKTRCFSTATLAVFIIPLSVILFGSEHFLATLGLETFRSEYRSILGFTLLITISVALVQLFIEGSNILLRQDRKLEQDRHHRQTILKNDDTSRFLSEEEKRYLSQCVFNNKQI